MQHGFQSIDDALKTAGIVEENRLKIYKILSGILLLGNIEFEQLDGKDGCFVSNASKLSPVAKLFGIDKEKLENVLVNRLISVKDTDMRFDLPFVFASFFNFVFIRND